MAKVKLEGLNIYRSRGRWYVYRRATGEAGASLVERGKEELALARRVQGLQHEAVGVAQLAVLEAAQQNH